MKKTEYLHLFIFFKTKNIKFSSTCQGGMESIIRGLLVDPIMKIDRWFSDDITKHLFETTDDLGKNKLNLKIAIYCIDNNI